MTRAFAFVLVVMALALALLLSCDRSQPGAELQQVGLAHAAELSGVCAAALEHLDRNELDKARDLLARTLRESVLHADGLVALGAKIDQPMPNVRAGMARAGAYAAHHDPQVADAASRVLAVLGPGPAAGTQ